MMKISKNKTSATLITLFLMLAMLTTLPLADAQNIIMNLPGNEGEPHEVLLHVIGYDIDLNGPSSSMNLSLFVKYPGRAAFTYIDSYITSSSGDFDLYTFDFNETGDFELKWAIPPTFAIESNTEIARVVTQYTPNNMLSYVYVGASPNPIGVGQETVIITWTADMPMDIGEETLQIDSPSGRQGWYDMKVNVIKPDGTNETLIFPYSDPVGANWIYYTPITAGNYTLQAIFPETLKEGPQGSNLYSADTSDPVTLIVQDEPINEWQDPPLPNDYWNRPLNTANRYTYEVAGNWLGGTANVWPVGSGVSSSRTERYAYGLGTASPHILWTKQYYTGGLMDDRYESTGYATAHYQGIGFSGVVLQGQLHYSPRITHAGTSGWAIVDLYTGEELMMDYDQIRPSRGSIYDYASPNQHGGFALLWRTSGVTYPDRVTVAHAELQTTTGAHLDLKRIRSATTIDSSEVRTQGTEWEMLDGFTGETICYIANVSASGQQVYSEDGSITYYNTRNLQGTTYLTVWNSSAGTMIASPYGTGAWQYRPAAGTFGGAEAFFGGTTYNIVHDGNLFWSLNVSIPSILGPRNSRLNETGSILSVREGDEMIIGTRGINDEQGIALGWMMGISLKDGQEGQKTWEGTWTPPSTANRVQASGSGFQGVYPEAGVFIYQHQRTNERIAFSLDTFQQIWKHEPETQFGYYGTSENVYNGILYSHGYGGVIYAYNMTTGDLMWTYEATSEGFEAYYGGRYPIGIAIISSDGKLYTVTGEHSPTQPLSRGNNLRCIDAVTGEELWVILGWFGGMSPTSSMILMSDGILAGLNFFDNQIYAFGKGPSATTVTASPSVSVYGSSVMIEGTVTDQSPVGRRNTNDILEVPLKDTPAISDEYMGDWMEYLFMQQAIPADATGVEVTLDTIDPNGNFVNIGTTTSDITGVFGYAFAPEVSGTYQIIATFDGSNSYGPSSAITYITVDDAPAATPAPIPDVASIADMYFIPAIAGVIIAVIAIGLVIILVLRKRP